MADNLQDIIDSLIDHIDKAIAKGSVTNQQVAAVLDFLNERLKKRMGISTSVKISRIIRIIFYSYLKDWK